MVRYLVGASFVVLVTRHSSLVPRKLGGLPEPPLNLLVGARLSHG